MLGMSWNTEKDVIYMMPSINFSSQIQRVWQGPDLRPDDIGQIDMEILMLRIVTSHVYGIYDPLGLLSPITIKYKMVLQELDNCGLTWDKPIPMDLDSFIRKVLKEIVLAGKI